jgi:uncharacterized protein
MPGQIPFVEYLVLGDDPYLRATECTACGARYFDRRNGCAACGGTEFKPVEVARSGVVTSFTIVAHAPAGVAVPFVAAIVDCDGTSVRGNIVGCPPDPDHVRLGMPVKLVTFPMGTDHTGTEAVGFGFSPIESGAQQQ